MSYNPVPKLTNGNATFNNDVSVSGLSTAGSGLLLVDLVPDSTTNRLYNDGGTLKFNGSAVGGGGGGSQNLFSTISVAGQSNVVADATTDTLTFVAGSNMTITTDASSDTITFASTGGGGGGGGAVSAVANGADNRLVTFSSSDALNGEANLTFDGTTVTYIGNAGSGLSITNDGGITASGDISCAGAFSAVTKSFLIDHPTKEGMKLQYASLEGPENGVYIRGTSGSNIITLPEYWSTLVDQSTVTVTLTPIGHYQALYIAEKGKNYIKVGGTKGSYDYVVYGERKDVEKLKVEW